MLKVSGIRVIITATAIVGLVVVATLITLNWPDAKQNGSVQAHDDGTIHIHSTLTPTPTPTPTPYPPAGLNGPLSLETSFFYRDDQRELVVIATVNNPPPDRWRMGNAQMSLIASSNDWNMSINLWGNPSYREKPSITFASDHVQAVVPLPDYASFAALTEPVLAWVNVNVVYEDEALNELIHLQETVYIDLHDRGNWK